MTLYANITPLEHIVKGVDLDPVYFHAAFIEHKKHKYLLSKMLNATYKFLV